MFLDSPRLEDYKILRQRRKRGETINDTARAAAVLPNLKIDYA
ncbi:hypothetical protein SSP24_72140 [Streptomyces spinoverrucosus]|uniref:Uncharacterized protein n=1 Tax=Streptomyces spinoverrucosus TaxID=284043 RepID=A0A4Y3VV60_9ACTN|nr:hypothetical protein [Streptomyces spinoverrucosus]GEC09559.1 hypothetical protein SSP24_72140 [Streptomyces spinoverrucosus]GHB95939.1 hypothetical protein GCM10010397_80740 [Streptomyces spinoverrucosus]